MIMRRITKFFPPILNIIAVATVIAVFTAVTAFAEVSGGTPEAAKENQGSATNISKQIAPLPPIDFSSSLMSMLKGLAICIALLLIVVWVLKKLKSPIVTGQGRSLRIIERLPVSAKSSILLIEVNKKRMLIGVGSDPVSLVSDFVDSESLGDSASEFNSGEKDE